MADSDAIRSRRYRLHKAGDHSLCDPERCQPQTEDRERLIEAVRGEFPPDDAFSRAVALQLATIGAGRGAAAVGALRALAEFASFQRRAVGAR